MDDPDSDFEQSAEVDSMDPMDSVDVVFFEPGTLHAALKQTALAKMGDLDL